MSLDQLDFVTFCIAICRYDLICLRRPYTQSSKIVGFLMTISSKDMMSSIHLVRNIWWTIWLIICRRRGRYRDTLPYIIYGCRITWPWALKRLSGFWERLLSDFYTSSSSSVFRKILLERTTGIPWGIRSFWRICDLSIKTFDAYDEEWLDFVFQCRKGEDKSEYDIVIGGITDDKIFKTIDLLTFISAEEITKWWKTQKT